MPDFVCQPVGDSTPRTHAAKIAASKIAEWAERAWLKEQGPILGLIPAAWRTIFIAVQAAERCGPYVHAEVAGMLGHMKLWLAAN